jgi:hypothetical protein
MKKYCILLCLFSLCVYATAQLSSQVRTIQNDLTFSTQQNFDVVTLPGNDYTEIIGSPKLPVKVVRYLIPLEANVTDVVVTGTEKTLLPGAYDILPAQYPIPVGKYPQHEFVQPDPKVYSSNLPFPGKYAELVETTYMMGYQIVTVKVFPVEYIPSEKKINLLTYINFTINYTLGGIPIELPRKISLQRQQSVKETIKSIIENKDDFERTSGGVTNVVQTDNPDKVIITDQFPFTLGVLPEYVIITNNQLKSSFQTLADWKTRKGYPTIIATIEDDIDGKYPGVDLGEKIRNYIKDITNRWGYNLFILLGGDVNIIPARMANWDSNPYVLEWCPTDLYYATVGGNWNANGNNQFGESNDAVDESPDNCVSRVPVRNTQDVINYTNKVLAYERMINPVTGSPISHNYLSRALALGAYIGESNGVFYYHTGCDFNHTFQYHFPSSVYKWRLYDDYNGLLYGNTCLGDEELTNTATLTHLSKSASDGYNIVFHCDHSGPYSMGTSSLMKIQSVGREDMDALTNGPAYNVFVTNGCSPVRFDKESVSKHAIWNPSGGSVLFIGNAATGYGSEDDKFNRFGDYLYTTNTTGILHAFNAFSYSFYTGNSGFMQRKWTLFGDPETPIWNNTPQTLAVTPSSAGLVTGQNNFSLTITGLTLNEEATVCILKANEVYGITSVTGTGNPVVVSLSCIINTPGNLTYTITAHNCIPYEGQLPVSNNPNASLYISAFTINDGPYPGVGNLNHEADAGETIDLPVTLSNSGLTQAPNVTGTLSCTDPDITIPVYYSSFGTIQPQGSNTSNPNYRFAVGNNIPDKKIVTFNLAMSGAPGQDDFTITCHSPVIDIAEIRISTTNNDNIITAGETVGLTIELKNKGSADGISLAASMSTSSPYINTTVNFQQSYGTIPAFQSGTNPVPFKFNVINTYNGEPLILSLVITNTYGKTWTFPIDLTLPAVLTWGSFQSTNNEIDLAWNANTSLKGYNLYRSSTENGTYAKINTAIIEGSAMYADMNLPEMTTFYYKVSGLSQSGVEGSLSAALEAWTSLPYKPGWPITVNQLGSRTEGSPMTYDVNGDGQKEVFITTATMNGSVGAVMGFKSNGEELFDIDHNVTTISGFYKFDHASSSSTVAIADVDQDNKTEVVVTTRNGDDTNTPNDGQSVFCFSATEPDANGVPIVKWRRNGVGRDFRGPVLADYINNGTTQISTKGEWGSGFYVLEGMDGSDYPGWPVTLSGYCPGGFGMPVVADLDQNGRKEYIIGLDNAPASQWCQYTFNAGILVFNSDGSGFLNPDGSFFRHYSTNSNAYDRMDSPIAIADMNGDGRPELICVSGEKFPAAGPYTAHLFILDANANCITNWGYNDHNFQVTKMDNSGIMWLPSASVGDINHDGRLEVVVAGVGRVYAWHNDGSIFTGFPVNETKLDATMITPLLADIDGDDQIEIVVAGNKTGEGKIYGYETDGSKVVGWPLNIGGVAATPCIDDIDNDGKNEIIAASGTTIYIWKSPGNPDKIEWGKFRYDANNNAVYPATCVYDPNGTITISSDETWTNEHYVTSDIEIEPGVTLTVKGKVYMASAARIFVKNGNGTVFGGKLIVNGGKLTTKCNDFWLGVEVWGNPNYRQNYMYQGSVQVTNGGTIENAAIGVLSGARLTVTPLTFDYSKAGGMVYGTNGVFKNNKVGVQFIDCLPIPGNPRFTLCQFLTTPTIFDISQFRSFIVASNIGSVGAYGCNFINSYSSDPHGTGISATGTGVYVGAQCTAQIQPCPEASMTHSVFTNLSRGIYGINGASPHGVSVSRTDFTGVTSGIYLSGFSSPGITISTFNVPGTLGGIQPMTPPYGLYLDNCTGYHVEGNEFYSVDPTPSSAGLIINNSGTADNEVYRNKFTNLRYGSAAQDVNKHPTDGITGLCFVCNTYKSTDGEIVVTRSSTYSRSMGISEYQHQYLNGANIPPFNLFYINYAATHYDIYNNCWSFTYPYSLSVPVPMNYTYQPIHYYNITPIQVGGSFSGFCLSKLDNGGASPDKTDAAISGNSSSDGEYLGIVAQLQEKKTLRSCFELAALYLEHGEVTSADNMVRSIPSVVSLSNDDNKEFQDFREVFSVYRDLRTQKMSFFDLSDAQTEKLKGIMVKNGNLSGAYARNLLIAGNKIAYTEPFIPPVFEEKSQEMAVGSTDFKVYPNPASDVFTVRYDLSEQDLSQATVNVYNMTGSLITSENLQPGNNQIQIQTRNWPVGLYLVSLKIGGTVMESVKINVVR